MKSYPSISKDIRYDTYLYVFDKLDGSNIRAEWSRKRGFYKFGTKNQLIDESAKPFGQSISLIRSKYEKQLNEIFKEQRWQEVVCFFEFYGKESFAGFHPEDDEKTVTLIDVNIYKQGLLEPSEFIKIFKDVEIPKVIHEGYINPTFVENIRENNIEGITFEGCICKGKNDKKTKMPIMFKIKTRDWLNKLKIHCKDDEKLFEKLA